MQQGKKLLCLLMSILTMISAASVTAFAAENNEVEPDSRLGDVNYDCVVNINDATLVQRYLAGHKEIVEGFESEQYSKYGADANSDGQIDINDVTLIQKVVAGLATIDEADEPEEPEEEETTTQKTYTINNIRNYIVGVDQPVTLADGTQRALINFDNAATTPAFKPVMDEVNNELLMYGSIGRGFSQKSNHSTDVYNSVRKKVLSFVNADENDYTCFYVNNTTDGLNKLASALIEKESDIVLTTRMEHHANDLSWRERCHVIYSEVDEKGRIDYDDMERMLKENKVKYVSVTAASNVTGYVTDVHRVARLAHRYNAKVVVDGAQIVAHREFSMYGNSPYEDIDFFVFSAHKMYSPYGGGAVVGRTDILNKHMPTFYGGGTVKIVGDYSVTYKDAPAAYEAGSPNYPGVVGLGKAIDVLTEVGFDDISEHEQVLNKKLINGLKKFDNIIIYGDTENISDKVGVVTFNFSNINSYLLAEQLSELGGIATRRGAFCAHPYVWRLMGISDDDLDQFSNCADINTPGMVRISFGIYNTEEEVDEFLRIMPKAMERANSEEIMRQHGNVRVAY